MYKRSAILICVLFLLLSVLGFVIVTSGYTEAPELTAESRIVNTGEQILLSDPAHDGTRLYALDADGLVRNMFIHPEGGRVDALTADAKYVYALLSDLEAREGGRVVRSYRVRRFTASLMPVATSAPLAVNDNQRVVNMREDEGVLFLTAISDDGRTAEVYPLVLQEFLPDTGAETEEESTEENVREDVYFPVSIAKQHSDTGRTYTDAVYTGGRLYVRTDAEKPADMLARSATETYAAENVTLSFTQKIKTGSIPAVTWVTVTLLVVAFTALMFMAFHNRRRLVYTALIAEVALFIMLTLFAFFSYRIAKESAAAARIAYAQSTLSSLAQNLGDPDAALSSEDF